MLEVFKVLIEIDIEGAMPRNRKDMSDWNSCSSKINSKLHLAHCSNVQLNVYGRFNLELFFFFF